jgi:hypothetical protein
VWSSTTGVVIVHDLGFVAELHGLAQAAFSDRPGVRVMQADPACRPVRRDSGDALAGLGGDLPGRIQQVG